MIKTISFAIVHMVVAFSVGYLMTGDILVGSALALIEPMVNTVAYYFHEKVWQNQTLIHRVQICLQKLKQILHAHTHAPIP